MARAKYRRGPKPKVTPRRNRPAQKLISQKQFEKSRAGHVSVASAGVVEKTIAVLRRAG
jgi:hypothetical protein